MVKSSLKNGKKAISWMSLVISLLALLISFGSLIVSRDALEYEKLRDSYINTPALNEKIVDSIRIQFFLTNDIDLQALDIIFPNELDQPDITLLQKPLQLSIKTLEDIAKSFYSKQIVAEEGFYKIGTVTIPVMIDYSAIVFGLNQKLRENRALVFLLYHDGNTLKLEFKNTFLIDRYGYPIKRQYHFKIPFFGKSRAERIYLKDREDIEELLQEQVKEIKANIERGEKE